MIETRYSGEHVWIRLDEDGGATVGLSDYAQAQLGDVVYIEAPEVGRDVIANEEVGIVESVKTTSELKAPTIGTVIAVNDEVLEKPELVNESPLDDGWIFRMRVDDEAALEELMDEDDYSEYVESLT